MAAEFVPDGNTILFGRGKACNYHPGNQRMRSIISNYKTQYRSASKGEKSKLVRKVYDELVGGGMKFIKQTEGGDGWEEVDESAAIQKVGHVLRHKLKPTSIEKKSLAQDASGNASNEERLKCTSNSSSIRNLAQEVAGLHKMADVPLSPRTRLPLTGSALHNDGGLGQSLTRMPTRIQCSVGSNPRNEELSQHLSMLSSIGALQQQIGRTSLPQGPGLPSTGDLLQNNNHRRGLVEHRADGFNGHGVANRLQNHLAQMELERQRSTLSALVGPLTPSGLSPFLSSRSQLSISGQGNLLGPLADANSQFNPVPSDDPMFWIRLAAASLLNKGG
ncbi:unnamed protein product [Cylindrotheca closterium]|uniref:DUF6824 domain-containing protein n=1 Tax=Cylindrotheca closterium TaxID=2856 RepID=A0AAD2FI83_9STRA|nr:unnamed protein product [Cylindrotheca closterium]